MTDARMYTMGIRVDLTLLLPERAGSVLEALGPRRYIERDELLPIGSVDLAKPELIKPTRSRVAVTRGERRAHGAQGPDPFRSSRVGGTRTRKDALVLGEFDLGSSHEALKMSLPSGMVEFDSVAYIPGLIGASMDMEKQPAGEPDTCDVTVRADRVPVDLRILRGAQVDAWIYTHGDPTACGRGNPGYFGGIVRNISKDRNDNTLTLSCVGYTWALTQPKVTPNMLAVKLDQDFAAVVRGMIEYVPGASRWKVLDDSETGSKTQLAVGLKSDRKKVTKKGRFFVHRIPGDLTFVGRRIKEQTIVTAPTVGHILGTADITVWAAILKMAALVGRVPNVSVDEGGRPVVTIRTAEEVQTLTRAVQRRMTDGVNISSLTESLDMDGGAKVDSIEVRSFDADTGKVFKGRAGRLTGSATSGNREVQVAQGLASDAACEARAAALWRSYWQAEFSAEISTGAPWSDGGGPDVLGSVDETNLYGAISGDADLLFAEPGETIQLGFAGLEGAAKVLGVDEHGTQQSVAQAHERLLRSRGIPEDSATRIAEAMQQVAPSTLFAIRTIGHSFDATGDGSYECRMELDAFLGHPEDQLVIFKESAEKAALGAL